jgi:hypothetical protein
LREADTSSLSTRIDSKVNISDTATMLSTYARKASPTFTGTVTTAQLDVVVSSLGTTQTETGLNISSATAAANNAQQISPAIRLKGSGWKTDATAGAQDVEFRAYVLPVQGTANPTGDFVIQQSINNAAYGDVFKISSGGVLTLPGYTTAGYLKNAVTTGVVSSVASIPQADVTNLTTDLSNKQPLDADLTTIAGLTATTNNFMVAVSSAWASVTPSDARTAMGATTVGGNLFTLANPSAITFPKINADNTVTAENAATHRTSIGATTVGGNLFTLTNPSAIRFIKINADNTITVEDASTFRSSIGAGTSSLIADATPTNGSTNAVTSDGVFDGLALKVNISDTASMLSTYAPEASPTFTGTVTSAQLDVTVNSLGTTQTETGLNIVSTTAAANNAQQISPALRFKGSGWKTDATAAARDVEFRIYALPIQGTANPTGDLVFQQSVNGGAYSDVLKIGTAGNLEVIGTVKVGSMAGVATAMDSAVVLNRSTGLLEIRKLPTGGGDVTQSALNDTAAAIRSYVDLNTTMDLWINETYLSGAGTQASPLSILTSTSPTNGSVLPITSDAVFDALALKQEVYSIVNVTSTTSSPAQTSGEIVILVDAATAGGAVTVNLPTAVGNTAKFHIKKIDSGSNTITIDANGAQTIDGATTQTIRFQWTNLTIVSNGSNWFIL